MGNNVNDSFLSKILKDNSFDSWLQGLYGQERTNQQSELKKVFAVVADNDVTNTQKKALEAKASSLEEQVEILEAKMAVLAEEMSKNEKKIQEAVNQIAELIKTVADKSEKMQEQQESWTKKCVKEVFHDYEEGIIGKDGIAAEIALRMQGCPGIKLMKADIEDALGDLDNQDNKVSGLIADASKWIDQKKILESQYGCTKSAYDMLKANIAEVGATGTNYTNMDTNTNVPVYSPEKVATVAGLLSETTYNVPASNKSKVEGAQAPTPMTLEQIKEKHAENLKVAASGSDKNSISNDAVKALGKALDDNLFEDLISTGMGFDEIKNFFADNFKNANIKVGDNGKLSIPYGHGKDAQAIFTKLNNKVKNYDPYKGELDTWSDFGNTIESNDQIAALKKFVEDGNFENLAKQGFTFKEAMYALFDPEKGLFKNTGIVYDLSKQGENPTYYMPYAGDDETAKFFKEIATKIYDNWGVGFYREGGDTEVGTTETPDDPNPTETKRTDPLSFHIGDDKNNKYSFVIDRDGDGKFDGKEEFVGGKEGSSWLDDLKSFDKDGNGVLEGDELKEVKLFGTKYKDNAEEFKKDGNLRGERTDVDYHFTNAANMGISSINLNDLEGVVNQTTGETDINNNEIFKDSFKMTMNGKEVEVKRLDETDSFMNTIYGDAYGKRLNLGLSEIEAEEIITKDYGEFDDFDARFANLFANIATLQSVDDIAQDTRMKYEDVLKLMQEQNNIELTKASNRAAALKEHASWSKIETEVLSIAIAKGLPVNDTDMIQMKGIFMQDGSLSAEGVVNKYQEQYNAEVKLNKAKAATKQTWAIMSQCVKNGIIPDAQFIMTELLKENPKSIEEIMEALKERMPDLDANVEVDVTKIGFDSEREKAIYEAFNDVFAQAGKGDKVVDALRDLCVAEFEVDNNLSTLTPTELAERFLKKY